MSEPNFFYKILQIVLQIVVPCTQIQYTGYLLNLNLNIFIYVFIYCCWV